MNKQLTDDMFQDALFNEDELGSVIRVHLHIEYHINEMLDVLMPNKNDSKELKLDFEQKIHLLVALGVKKENKNIFLALANIRNKFAHNPFYELNKSEINNLYKALTPEDRNLLQKAHDITRKKDNSNNVKAYKDLEPRDKFIIISVIIRSIAIGMLNEIKQKNV